jgi:uracil-DNA glycosylase family 4
VPGFGDPRARVLVVGLAPAAHGGNRTGRVFTGDESGNWLYRALHAAGFANQPTSVSRDDGLRLVDAYVTGDRPLRAADNKPTPEELARCRPFLVRELELLGRLQVVVVLGKIAHDGFLAALAARATQWPSPAAALQGTPPSIGSRNGLVLLCSYHREPSRTPFQPAS